MDPFLCSRCFLSACLASFHHMRTQARGLAHTHGHTHTHTDFIFSFRPSLQYPKIYEQHVTTHLTVLSAATHIHIRSCSHTLSACQGCVLFCPTDLLMKMACFSLGYLYSFPRPRLWVRCSVWLWLWVSTLYRMFSHLVIFDHLVQEVISTAYIYKVVCTV